MFGIVGIVVECYIEGIVGMGGFVDLFCGGSF